MAIIMFLFFVLAPVILALTSRSWLWRLGYLAKLPTAVGRINQEVVALPFNHVTVETIRGHERLGDKIVVAHHLLGFAEDVEEKLRVEFSATTALTATVVIFVAMASVGGGEGSGGLVSALSELGESAVAFYAVPAPALLATLFQGCRLLTLREQVRKYRHLL